MIKIGKKEIIELLEAASMRKNCSAWNRGVKNYALELLEKLPNDYYFESKNAVDFEDLRKILLKGNTTWREYSYRGNSCISNTIIAFRLCTPSEFRKTKGGERNPNKHETWLDVQGHALRQAWYLIKNVIRDFEAQ